MDLNSFTRRRLLTPSKYTDQPQQQQLSSSSSSSGVQVMKRFGFSTMAVTKILAVCFVALPVLFALSMILRHSPSDRSFGFADARVLENTPQFNVTLGLGENVLSQVTGKDSDKLLGGLLAVGFNEAACTSRYQSYLYRKTLLHKPSSYLIARLRSFEDLYKHCGPNTESYSKALEQLKSGQRSDFGSADCQYVVWISFSGLGNRILSLASTFLYALLTNRVLLVDRGKDMADLFCEPFPEKSWFLPLDFPIIDQFGSFDQKSSLSYGNILKKNNAINASAESILSYLYLHLVHDYDDHDKLFFCDQDQSLLAKVPWLILKSDNYFVPSLFLITSFEQELSNLFPEKGTVFHHLGRYLFHPSNHVWGLITRYYKTYLDKAEESIGIQIRVFDERPGPFKYVMDQILACTLNEKLLPQVDMQDSVAVSANPKTKAVLVTSLNSGYSEILKNMYWEHPTMTGEVVGVYQPSHEEYQQTEKQMHNRKAWAEMYLLSLTDRLVTSSWSTFGYVAQGLGGLKPWILYKPENETAPDPPCRRAMSMDPCFHAPPFYDCKAKTGTDTGALVPHVRHCEDMSWGLKVVDGHDEL